MGMGHFHKLLCEEMIFSLLKGKNDGLRYEVIIFSRRIVFFAFRMFFSHFVTKKEKKGKELFTLYLAECYMTLSLTHYQIM